MRGRALPQCGVPELHRRYCAILVLLFVAAPAGTARRLTGTVPARGTNARPLPHRGMRAVPAAPRRARPAGAARRCAAQLRGPFGDAACDDGRHSVRTAPEHAPGFTGTARRWRARVVADGRRVALGPFVTEEEAARAYDA
eukprot:gene29824-45667_t